MINRVIQVLDLSCCGFSLRSLRRGKRAEDILPQSETNETDSDYDHENQKDEKIIDDVILQLEYVATMIVDTMSG